MHTEEGRDRGQQRSPLLSKIDAGETRGSVGSLLESQEVSASFQRVCAVWELIGRPFVHACMRHFYWGNGSFWAQLLGGSVYVSVPGLQCAKVSSSTQSGVAALRASMCKCHTGKSGIQGLTLSRVSESSAGGIHIMHVYRYFPKNEPASCSAIVGGISPLALCVMM